MYLLWVIVSTWLCKSETPEPRRSVTINVSPGFWAKSLMAGYPLCFLQEDVHSNEKTNKKSQVGFPYDYFITTLFFSALSICNIKQSLKPFKAKGTENWQQSAIKGWQRNLRNLFEKKVR